MRLRLRVRDIYSRAPKDVFVIILDTCLDHSSDIGQGTGRRVRTTSHESC